MAFITTLMTGCIPFRPGSGEGGPSPEYYRDEPFFGNGGYYANRPYFGRGRSYHGNTIVPVRTITLSMTTTRQTITTNMRTTNSDIRRITTMIRSSVEKVPEWKAAGGPACRSRWRPP
jgi:hypothetical protein